MKALAVLNVGGQSIHPKSRESFEAAAARWGVEFVELRGRLAPVHIFWQKAFAPVRLADYERVLQLDADMLIRDDAPDPFALVPAESIGVVSACQFPGAAGDVGYEDGKIISRHREFCVGQWSKWTGLPACPDSKHLNGGFFLYGPQVHAGLFHRLRECGQRNRWNPRRLPEQVCLSLLLHSKAAPATWLPAAWNTVAAGQDIRPEHNTGRMNGFIYHFTGRKLRGQRIDRTAWRVMQSDGFSARPAVESAGVRQAV
jgi:hypothetical protein